MRLSFSFPDSPDGGSNRGEIPECRFPGTTDCSVSRLSISLATRVMSAWKAMVNISSMSFACSARLAGYPALVVCPLFRLRVGVSEQPLEDRAWIDLGGHR